MTGTKSTSATRRLVILHPGMVAAFAPDALLRSAWEEIDALTGSLHVLDWLNLPPVPPRVHATTYLEILDVAIDERTARGGTPEIEIKGNWNEIARAICAEDPPGAGITIAGMAVADEIIQLRTALVARDPDVTLSPTLIGNIGPPGHPARRPFDPP